MSKHLLKELDDAFVHSLKTIEQNYTRLSKHLQIRIQLWIEKLLESDENAIWKKSRNNYIRLLKVMVLNDNITSPFDRIPPKGDLATLTDHELQFQFQKIGKTDRPNFTMTACQRSQAPFYQISSPKGDYHDVVTPNCDTDRYQKGQFNMPVELSSIEKENLQENSLFKLEITNEEMGKQAPLNYPRNYKTMKVIRDYELRLDSQLCQMQEFLLDLEEQKKLYKDPQYTYVKKLLQIIYQQSADNPALIKDVQQRTSYNGFSHKISQAKKISKGAK